MPPPTSLPRPRPSLCPLSRRSVCAHASVHAGAGVQPPPSELQAAYTRRTLLLAGAAAALTATHPHAATAASSLTPLPPDAAAAVKAAFDKEAGKSKSAVLLRLAFHDAAPFNVTTRSGGANASIQFELDRPENFGLKRGWRVIEAVRARLAGTAGANLSAADLIALGGSYSVAVTGGPPIPVPIGRIDATSADPPGRMPSEDSTPEELINSFSKKGLTPRDLVALSGAHTLGAKGFGDPVTFDNTYYKTLLEAPWAHPKSEMDTHIGLPSDHALPTSAELRPMIEEYAANQAKFYTDFVASYVKMVGLGWE